MKAMPCARCGSRFEPNRRQLAMQRRGQRLYCSPECQSEQGRIDMAAWWRSEAGKDYQRARWPRNKKRRRSTTRRSA